MSVTGINNDYAAQLYSSASSTSASSLTNSLAGAAQNTEDDLTSLLGTGNVSIDGDTYEKSSGYATIDASQVTAIKKDLWTKVDAFEKMVNALFQKQGITYDQAQGMKKNLENLIESGGVSEEDKAAAQEAISEDGYFGVEKTSQRILDYAKAISGGDSGKIEQLRAAFQKGYEDAEKIWGDELPEICRQTYEKVMQGFDDWANESVADTTTTSILAQATAASLANG